MRRLLPPIVALLLLAARAAGQDAPVVQSIDFEGLRIHTPDEVRLKMESHAGRPFSRDVLDRDIRRLFATGWFADVRLSDKSVMGGPDGVILVLDLLENDVLREIRYVGNRKFNDSELSTGALLKTDEYFAPYKVKLDADRIRVKYLEEGFVFVKVEPSAAASEHGTIITFTVREGPHVRVSDIEFHGNENLSSYALRKEMQTSEKSLWTIFSPPVLRADMLEEDIKILNRYARNEGYLDARIYVRELVWDEDKSNVDIHFQVDEGVQYVVDSVEIKGNTIFPTADLMEGLRVKAGEPYALKYVDRDETWLVDKYREKAYIDADTVPEARYTEQKGHVKLTWNVKEGSKVYVGRIDFFGNGRTMEKVLRREFLLLPGEEFNKKLLDQSMDRLRSLGYWEPPSIQLINRAWYPVRDPIVVVEALPGQTKDERDLAVHVNEGRTGSLRFGGSYNDQFGFAGLLDVTQRNFDITDLPKNLEEIFTGEAFAGAGQVARINLQPGLRRSRYEVSFTEPWVLDYPIAMTLSGTRFDQDFRFYREQRLAGSLDLWRRWDDFELWDYASIGREARRSILGTAAQGAVYAASHIPGFFLVDEFLLHSNSIERFWERGWGLGTGYRVARINIRNMSDSAPTDLKEVAGLNYLSSVSVRVTLDRRNSRVFPSQGVMSSVAYEHAGYPFGGDFDFWKYSFRNEAYTTVWTDPRGGKWVFATDLRAGLMQEHYYSPKTPIFERFYAGGADSIRGLEARTVSPKENDEPIGGNVQILATAEFHFPIYRPEISNRDVDILRFALFTDWGTVVARPTDLGDYRWSVGFGFRIQIPLGPQVIPVSLDFGFPLRKEPGDERQTVHVGFDFGF